MCRGREETKEEAPRGGAVRLACCELCGWRASLYCPADDAFLCKECDGWVHGANFLARRHVRCVLCDPRRSSARRFLVGDSTEVDIRTLLRWKERSSKGNSNMATKE